MFYKNKLLRIFYNNQLFHLLSLYIIFLIIIFFLNGNLYFNDENIKHLSTYFRDDIVFVYNSLLYSQGLDIHHLDHPSLFTYFFFSIFYKIFSFFGFLNASDLNSLLNSGNFESTLNKLFYVSRLLIQIISFLIIYLIYILINKYSSDKFISFLISILFICSVGFTSASNRLESGLISLFFALLAYYFLIRFLESQNKRGLLYFSITFLFIFSAMMQKKIIFFLFPFLFLSAIFLLKKNFIEYFKYKFFNINRFYLILLAGIYLFVLTFISFKTIIKNTSHLPRDMDFVFLIISYFGLNLILFYFIKFFQNKNYTNLLTFNIVIGVTYILYKYILINFFAAPIAVWSISFTNFIGQLNMFVGSEEIKGAHEFSNFLLYLKKIYLNLILSIKKYFFSFSFQSILLWSNILLLVYNFRIINFQKKFSILLLLFGFLIVQSVLLFRYEQDTYYLNSEILLLLALALNLSFLKKSKSIIFMSIILILTFFPVYTNLNKIKLDNFTSFCGSVDLGFYSYYVNKIPENKINSFCNNYNVLK